MEAWHYAIPFPKGAFLTKSSLAWYVQESRERGITQACCGKQPLRFLGFECFRNGHLILKKWRDAFKIQVMPPGTKKNRKSNKKKNKKRKTQWSSSEIHRPTKLSKNNRDTGKIHKFHWRYLSRSKSEVQCSKSLGGRFLGVIFGKPFQILPSGSRLVFIIIFLLWGSWLNLKVW